MKRFTVEDLTSHVAQEYEVFGDPAEKTFVDVRAVSDATESSLVWINPNRRDKQQLLESTRARIVICDKSLDLTVDAVATKCFVVVPRPKLAFIAVFEALFPRQHESGVHPSAVVHPEAEIADDVFIGPFTYVGRSSIGAGSTIHGHCHIHDNVTIGRNVVVHAGCVIGAEGFGFERDEDGSVRKFPHIGGVVIEDDVELQVMTDVDRGALGDTVIRRGAKIDSFCHIGHNVEIGEDTLVAAQAMLGGSLKVGKRCWLGPATVFRDVLEVGDDAFVGLGALVVKDVGTGERVMGSPARPIAEYKRMLSAVRAFAENRSREEPRDDRDA